MEYFIAYTTRASSVIKENGKEFKAKIEMVFIETLNLYRGSIAALPDNIKLVGEGKFKNVPRLKFGKIIIPFKLEKVDEYRTKLIVLDIIF